MVDRDGGRGRTTLADVADAAGVAVSTVSRALSDPGRVNTATAERIARIAADLDYVPAGAARAPVTTRTPAVAVFVSDVTNPFYFGIIRGTQQHLRAAGYAQILIDTEESDELEDGLVESVRGMCDGAILAASRLPDRRLIEIAEQTPLVAINRQTADVATVFIDTPTGMHQVLDHLVSLGHRDIGYAAGPDASWASLGRWQALRSGARRLGVRVSRLGPFVPSQGTGAAAADAALHSGVTACIAFDDMLAIGMLMRLRERGVGVPDRMSIVGCDDVLGADFCSPPLTTLTAPIEQAGRVASSLLLARISDPTGTRASERRERRVSLSTHLTVRSSTGPAPAR